MTVDNSLLFDRVIDSINDLMQRPNNVGTLATVLGDLIDHAKKGGDMKKQINLMLFVNILDVIYRRREQEKPK
jgi:hypothetical protein